MARTVAEMSVEDLRSLIGEVLGEKLREIFAEPDESLELREEVADRLRDQRRQVAAGERGEELEVVLDRLGIA